MKEPPDPNEIDTSKFTVVKSTLNQFCNNNFIKQKLNQHVLNSNKLIFEVYKFANLHLLRCFRDNDRCCNNECRMIIDRDINGCKNILKMLMVSLNKMDKPDVFKRTNKSLPSLNVSAKVKTL